MPGPSGIVVKPDNGMKVGPAYACIRVLRESIGSLPWEVYERLPAQDDGADNRVDADHYLTPIIGRKPNAWQTIMEVKEMAVAHLCLRGNFYAHIIPARSGVRPEAAEPGQDAGRPARRRQPALHLHAQTGHQADLCGQRDLPRPRPLLERHYGRERAGICLPHDGPLDRPADARGQSFQEWRPADVLDQAPARGQVDEGRHPQLQERLEKTPRRSGERRQSAHPPGRHGAPRVEPDQPRFTVAGVARFQRHRYMPLLRRPPAHDRDSWRGAGGY